MDLLTLKEGKEKSTGLENKGKRKFIRHGVRAQEHETKQDNGLVLGVGAWRGSMGAYESVEGERVRVFGWGEVEEEARSIGGVEGRAGADGAVQEGGTGEGVGAEHQGVDLLVVGERQGGAAVEKGEP
ncbi:hypothetical protein AMTR_s00025p00057790 [Amborella trichopoda]|uniref:Uncharacterized protein n=1 Tax=Amborella trichopoda TaxID=13333 RepID=W1PWX7_AMBTC|nr:hypothetical protein AMTR_s00025p00057790 [Amborella trichopoda]